MKTLKNVALMLLIAVFILTSCTLFSANPNPSLDENAINTSVALTVAATQPVSNTAIVITATPETQALPTITPVPLSVEATATPNLPTVTPTADNCNLASFKEDVTIPDDTQIFAGSTFTKTWRVMNVGTCTWNTNYALVTYSGDDLGAPAVSLLPTSVPPGGTIDLSVNLTAPSVDGTYTQRFRLRSDTGLIFATGDGGVYSLYVRIKVVHVSIITLMPTVAFHFIPLETMVYDLAANYCSATWKYSGTGILTCPGTTSDATGFVVRNDSPYLQDGKQYTGETLFTHPQWIDGGTIAGFFPAQAIQNGYRFRTILGCAQGGSACDVYVQLNYSSDGGPTKSLQTWHIKYGDAPTSVDVDLSSLAGHNVALVLAVSTNGSSGQDWLQWVSPRIIK